MDKNNVIELKKPELVEDLLTAVLRNGARRLLKGAPKDEKYRYPATLVISEGAFNGEFPEALEVMLDSEVKGLSASTVSRFKTVWEKEYNLHLLGQTMQLRVYLQRRKYA